MARKKRVYRNGTETTVLLPAWQNRPNQAFVDLRRLAIVYPKRAIRQKAKGGK